MLRLELIPNIPHRCLDQSPIFLGPKEPPREVQFRDLVEIDLSGVQVLLRVVRVVETVAEIPVVGILIRVRQPEPFFRSFVSRARGDMSIPHMEPEVSKKIQEPFFDNSPWPIS